MTPRRSQVPLVDQLPTLMKERGLSTNRLAGMVRVSQSHLSRVLTGARRKTVGGELAARIAIALELPEDWFPETRQQRLMERLKADAELRDRLYDEMLKTASSG
jgi:transcriptional regulator with XRE-family HTH domain